MITRRVLRPNLLRTLTRFYSEVSGSNPTVGSGASASSSSGSTPPSPQDVPDVPGLSSACVDPAAAPVGPGVDPKKTGAYKVPEYYQYNAMTYFEAEVEMAKYRIPQPSARTN